MDGRHIGILSLVSILTHDNSVSLLLNTFSSITSAVIAIITISCHINLFFFIYAVLGLRASVLQIAPPQLKVCSEHEANKVYEDLSQSRINFRAVSF